MSETVDRLNGHDASLRTFTAGINTIKAELHQSTRAATNSRISKVEDRLASADHKHTKHLSAVGELETQIRKVVEAKSKSLATNSEITNMVDSVKRSNNRIDGLTTWCEKNHTKLDARFQSKLDLGMKKLSSSLMKEMAEVKEMAEYHEDDVADLREEMKELVKQEVKAEMAKEAMRLEYLEEIAEMKKKAIVAREAHSRGMRLMTEEMRLLKEEMKAKRVKDDATAKILATTVDALQNEFRWIQDHLGTQEVSMGKMHESPKGNQGGDRGKDVRAEIGKLEQKMAARMSTTRVEMADVKEQLKATTDEGQHLPGPTSAQQQRTATGHTISVPLDTFTALLRDTASFAIDQSVRSSLVLVARNWKTLEMLRSLHDVSQHPWRMTAMIRQRLEQDIPNCIQTVNDMADERHELDKVIAKHLDSISCSVEDTSKRISEQVTLLEKQDADDSNERNELDTEREKLKSAWEDVVKAIATQHQSAIEDIASYRSEALSDIAKARFELTNDIYDRVAVLSKMLDRKVDKLDETMLAFEARHPVSSLESAIYRSDLNKSMDARPPIRQHPNMRFVESPEAARASPAAFDPSFSSPYHAAEAHHESTCPNVGTVSPPGTYSAREIEAVDSQLSAMLASIYDRPALWEGADSKEEVGVHRGVPANAASGGGAGMRVVEGTAMNNGAVSAPLRQPWDKREPGAGRANVSGWRS